jgi:hypothetical protein
LNTEHLSWANDNAAGALASPLKLSSAGYRQSTQGTLTNVGTNGRYRAYTFSTNSSANYLLFKSGSASTDDELRSAGFSIRCIKD